MKVGSRPRARQEGRSTGASVTGQLLGDVRRPLVVGNAAEDEPAKCDQLNKRDLIFNLGVTQRGRRLLALNLRLKIEQRNRAVGRRRFGNSGRAGQCPNR
jgi:hypothetical protein